MAAVLYTRLYCSKPMAISSFVSLDGRKRKNINVSVSSKFSILKTIKSSSSFMDRNKKSKEPQTYVTLEEIAAKDRKIFSFETLDAATTNFSDFIGEGCFGAVYKGRLENGKEIAVKKLSNATPQGKREFHEEANVLTGLQHRNVVKLLGYCAHNNDYLFVYEFLPYSLDQFLSGSNEKKQLNWTERFGIINDIAKGLRYLHFDNRDRIVHRDIKPNNILLDQELKAKIADFGISRFFPEDRTHETASKAIGSRGYKPPEYRHRKHVSIKLDVYSFGVLMLELISGQRYCNYILPLLSNDEALMVGWAYKLHTNARSLEFLDPAIADPTVTDIEQVIRCIEIALLCVQGVSTARPDMEYVMSMLTGNHGPREASSILKPGVLGYLEDRYDMPPLENQMMEQILETRKNIYGEY